MPTKYGAHGTRTVKAQKPYYCDNCGGIIFAREPYENHREDPRGGRTWQGRRHLDCEAAWWQVETHNLLPAVGKLPADVPAKKFDIELTGSQYTLKTDDASPVGRIDWSLQTELRRMIAYSSIQRGNEALKELSLAHELFLTSLQDVAGDPKAALQFSHLLQQMYQVARNAKQRHSRT